MGGVKYFDSHCHLNDRAFEEDLDAVLIRAHRAGVEEVVVGTDLDSSRLAVKIAQGHAGCWATVGLHPHEAGRASSELWEALRDLLDRDRVVAVGETGLDYHYMNSPKAIQREALAVQLRLGAELALPVILHSRGAGEDLLEVLAGEADAGQRVIFHCYSEGTEILRELLAFSLDSYVSFSGIVSFKNFQDEDAVRLVPPDRLLVETDAPYLAPVPHRGRRNEPAFLPAVVKALAAHRGEDPETLADRSRGNARRCYGLDRPGALG